MRAFFFLLLACVPLAAQGNEVSGVVVDHLTKRPLEHVLVEMKLAGRGGDPLGQAITESDGRFAFLRVPNGKYNLTAQRRGQSPQGFRESEGGFSSAIVVDGKRQTTGLIFALQEDAAISGLVMGDDGDPVRGAQVHLLREAVLDGEAQVLQAGGGMTNSEGHFHIGRLVPGKYYLAVSGRPWYAQYGRGQTGAGMVYPVTFYGDTTDGEAARAITVAEGMTANVQIELHATPEIHVMVPGGVQNVLVSVRGPGGSEVGVNAGILHGGIAAAKTTENRELIGLAAGRYQVSMVSEVGDVSVASQTVDLVDGSTLAMEENAGNAEVGGRVVYDGARPGGELEVVLVGGRRRGSSAKVGADGTFHFEKAPAGKFDLHLTSGSLVIAAVEAKGARVLHGHVEIGPGASAELTVHVVAADGLATVEGVAVKDGTAAAGVMVLLVPQDLERTREFRRDQSDMDGSFSLSRVLPGRYTVVAIQDGGDLAYKDEKVIRKYLEKGVGIVVPVKDGGKVEVGVQGR